MLPNEVLSFIFSAKYANKRTAFMITKNLAFLIRTSVGEASRGRIRTQYKLEIKTRDREDISQPSKSKKSFWMFSTQTFLNQLVFVRRGKSGEGEGGELPFIS